MRFKIFLLLILSTVSLLHAENWPQWRGPSFDGTSKETGLPSKLDKNSNLAWSTPMPGPSGATPIIWEDRVFVSSVDKADGSGPVGGLAALCLDRKTGKVLWQKSVGTPNRTHGGESNMASPSPVTDGKAVYFLYGTGDLLAFDFEGKELWRRNLTKDHGDFAIMWGYGSSPTLYKEKLYVLVLQRDKHAYNKSNAPAESYMLALDPKTGKDLFKHIRKDEARDESKESYATIIPFEFNGRSELLVAGGDCFSGHNPDDGKELWRFGGWNPAKINHWRLVVSPAFGDGMLWVNAPKNEPLFCIKAGGTGDISTSGLQWKFAEKRTADVCTPLYYQGLLYVVDSSMKTVTCLDAKTGEKKWQQVLGGKEVFRASPTAADGKIYLANRSGELRVLKAGPEYVLLSQTDLEENQVFSTLAISQGNVYVRSGKALYCFK